MVKTFRQARAYSRGVSASEFRRRLAHYIGCVRYGGDFVAIGRKGEDNVYLISQADWDLLGKKIDDLDSGKFDPKLRVRHSGLWELLNWESHRANVAALMNWRRGREPRLDPAVSEEAPPPPSHPPASKDRASRGRPDPMDLVDGALARLEKIGKISPKADEDDGSDR